MLIELPSGLKGEVRKIRGSETIELAERATSQGQGNSIGAVLRGCWLQTLDPGPYAHAADGQGPDWDRVLKGDLLAGLLALRAASVVDGARYDFHVQCTACKVRYGWTVLDLMNDLPVRRLPAESAERLRAGLPFQATAADPDGPQVLRAVTANAAGAAATPGTHALTFDLMLPAQDAVLRALMKSMGRKRATPVESLAAQTRTIDGEARSPAARQRFFKDLDLGELNRLRDLYDAADCGIDVDILTTCPEECGWQQETALPFGRTFWRPETRPPLKVADKAEEVE